MKKVCAILMAVCLLLAGLCPALAEEKTYSIGICQLAPHPALDAATKGFRDFLTESWAIRLYLMKRTRLARLLLACRS